MSDTYTEVDDELAASLIDSILQGGKSAAPSGRSEDLEALVNALIEALPPYSDSSAVQAHRDALARQLARLLPTAYIATEPGYTTYYYDGPYSNYREAYYRNVGSTAAQQQLNSNVASAAGQLNNNWWGNYSVAILTDCCKSHYSVDINAGSLDSALDRFHNEFLPGLSPSYMAVLTDGYSPTKEAFQAIFNTGRQQEAAEILNDGISANGFRTNFNAMILQPGDSAVAAEWFQYNLWIALKALQYPDVDAAINAHEAEGLIVHDPLKAYNWWRGDYNIWFTQLTGDLVYDFAQATMQENFPTFYCSSGMGYHCYDRDFDHGYVSSLCEWGNLSYYN